VRLPQDIANLLAVAIRDVVWFKGPVLSFLRDCGVPESIMIGVERARKEPTVKLIHFVLDELDKKGEEGFTIARSMLTKMHYWKDVHSIAAERKDQAIKSLKELQSAYTKWQAQTAFQREQEEKMHSERIERTKISDLDHNKLQGFRDEFDRIHAIEDRQKRGNEFQSLMNEIFDYYSEQSKGAFNRTGEQIDGLFYFDKHWHYVEVRWKKEKAIAADVSVLRDRARNAFGGDTKALFISFNGFSEDCLLSLEGSHDERVILMDGYDLRCVLNCDLAFDVLLAEKQSDIVQNKRPFVGIAAILAKRRG